MEQLEAERAELYVTNFAANQEQAEAMSSTRSSRPFRSTQTASGIRHPATHGSDCDGAENRSYIGNSGLTDAKISFFRIVRPI
jgi:hypothetical protein